MTRFTSFALVALPLLMLASCGQIKAEPSSPTAQSISIEQAASDLDVIVADFKSIFKNDKIGRSVDFMPPKLKESILKGSSVSEAELKDAVNKIWTESLETVSLESFDFDMSANPIETLADGRRFKVIPTSMVLSINNKPNMVVDSQSETLAIMENGSWYLIRLDQPSQVQMFHNSYPEYASIDVAPQTMVMREKGAE